MGISAAGRTKILRRNYRNTDEILTCARSFADALLSPVEAGDDGVPLLFPVGGGRKGKLPRFARLASMQAEAEYIASSLLSLHASGVPWNEMGVFHTAPFVGEEIAAALTRLKVPFDWLQGAAKTYDPSQPTVKLMTPHSSKGLQFRVCVIGGVGYWPYPTPHQSEMEQARLLYVAMTRATHELVLTSSRGSRFSERLMALCA